MGHPAAVETGCRPVWGGRRDDVSCKRKSRQRLHAARPKDSIMPGQLIVTDEDATRVITLRRPEKKNAITQ
ncbi:MAG TPA: hypothetical protein VLT36_04715, partial [Candidatus Dormibacteraeota bacterium]|nr:hypothetical protein [Candidatus Dormibacteraeota bacterium]